MGEVSFVIRPRNVWMVTRTEKLPGGLEDGNSATTETKKK